MKRIKNTDQYEPGIIYELRCCIGDEWHAFYVGETTNAEQRKKSHARSGKSDQRLVYQFIRETLTPNGIEWNLFPVNEYGSEGPTDLEHEHIMSLLYDGVRLKNMKKGSEVWMQKQIEIASDMRNRNIRSYRKYREILNQEAQQRIADTRQEQWKKDQYRSELVKKVEQKRMEINAKEAEIKQIKMERELARAAEIRAHRANQQAAWEAEKAKQLEEADRKRARQRKESLAQRIADAAEAERQAALAAARAEAFEKEWPEHQARINEREQFRIQSAQSRIENVRYMRELERRKI